MRSAGRAAVAALTVSMLGAAGAGAAGAATRRADATAGRARRVAVPHGARPNKDAPQLKICSFDSSRSRAPFSDSTGQLGYGHLRTSLLNSANFGPSGVVHRTVVIAAGVSTITSSNIADCDVFFTSVFSGDLSWSEASALAARYNAGMKVITDADGSSTDEQSAVRSVLAAIGVPGTVGPDAVCNNDTVSGGTVGSASDAATVGAFGDLRSKPFGTTLAADIGGVTTDIGCSGGDLRAVKNGVMFGGDPSAFDIFTTGQENNEVLYLNFIASNASGLVPRASVGDTSVYEGDAGTHNVDFSVILDQPGTSTIIVKYKVFHGSGDSATEGNDFVAKTGTVTFNPVFSGKTPTVQTFPVTIKSDTAPESNERYTVKLTTASGATFGRNTGHGTIVNDDAGSGIRLTVSNVSLVEGNQVATQGGANFVYFHLHLSKPVPSGRTVSVTYSVVNGTATGGSSAGSGIDFVKTSSPVTVTFSAGQSDKTVKVNVFADTRVERDETFMLNVTHATNATIQHGTGTGTILNDD